ncbi:MAG: glycoside hydrolase family 97 protein, partial [Ignavibacteria bacterium]|nr:glycoside hydrolase family 97 protein [Ignavibacteria bacterium]
MKKILLLIFVTEFMVGQTINSPNNKQALSFWLSAEGAPTYDLKFAKTSVILPSKMGFKLKDQPSFEKGFTIVKVESSKVNETWKPVLGEVSEIRNKYSELKIYLSEKKEKERKIILT